MAKTSYKSISIVAVSGTEKMVIPCFGLTAEKNLAPGDKLTVAGEVRNHNGTIEFNHGSTCEIAPPTTMTDAGAFEALKALQADENAPRGMFTITGVVISIEKEPRKGFANFTYFVGAFIMFLVGLFYMFMSDLTFKNPSSMLIVSVLLSFTSAILFFFSATLSEKHGRMMLTKVLAVLFAAGFVVYIHLFQLSDYYLGMLDKFHKAGIAGEADLQASKLTMLITQIGGYIAVVAQFANMLAVVKAKD